MSLMHPSDDDADLARGHAEEGFAMRVRWVKRLRAALLPFAEGRATDADRAEARAALDETKEWL